MHKDIRKVRKAAEAQGFRVKERKNGHITLYPPNTQLSGVTIPSTPSDYRSMENCLALLRQVGYIDNKKN